jgi:hypothetical protein
MKTIKTLLIIAVVGALGFVGGHEMMSQALLQRHQGELARQQAAWDAEKAEIEAALQRARSQSAVIPTAVPAQVVQVTNHLSPAEILERLKTMRAPANQPRSARLLVHQFENLIEAGPTAVPAIREFLARNEDIEYEAGIGKGFRGGKVPTAFPVPPSLRLGLLEALKTIGGDAAEQALVEVLKVTGRGVEVAYLAGALEEMAPNQHRDLVLSTARELILKPLMAGSTSPLDKYDREYLYGVLGFFKDNSSVAQAQAQLIQADGKIDKVALRYLQQALGEQSITTAAQAWQDPRIPADQKEPLARVALNYVGVNPEADKLYQTAINDPNLSGDARRNLIEDLNETGFADPKNLTMNDLSLIEKRLRLIEESAPNSLDEFNRKAWDEAKKDLTNMRDKLLAQSNTPK